MYTTRSKSLLITLCLGLAAAAPRAAAQDDAYFAAIEQLGANGRAIAMASGKDTLIAEYQTLIQQYPDLPKTVQLATQVGLIYEWDLTDAGQPPDLQKAYDTYLGVIDTYDPTLDYMKKVLSLAASRALTLDPTNAESLYRRMLEQYPEDDSMQLEGRQGLARLAEQRGDLDAARDLYEEMLRYQPVNPSGYYGEGSNALNIQDAAAALLMADAVRGLNSKQDRLAALDNLLEKYPELMARHRDLVNQFRQTLESQDEITADPPQSVDVAMTVPAVQPVPLTPPSQPAVSETALKSSEVPATTAASTDPPKTPAIWNSAGAFRYGAFTCLLVILLASGYALRRVLV